MKLPGKRFSGKNLPADELAIGKVCSHSNLVGTGHILVPVDRYGLYIHSASPENVKRSQSLGLLEAVCQKNIYSFHIIIIINYLH